MNGISMLNSILKINQSVPEAPITRSNRIDKDVVVISGKWKKGHDLKPGSKIEKLLTIMKQCGKATNLELSEAINSPKPSTRNQMERLLEAGYVKRERIPGQGREYMYIYKGI